MKNLKYIVSLVGVLGLGTVAGWAQPAEGEQAAPAGRGPGRQRPSFSQLDLNHDGSISPEEFDKARAERRGRGGPGPGAEARPAAEGGAAAEARPADAEVRPREAAPEKAEFADRPERGGGKGPGLRRRPGRGGEGDRDGEFRGPRGHGRQGRGEGPGLRGEGPRPRMLAENGRRSRAEGPGVGPRGPRGGGPGAGAICPECRRPMDRRGEFERGPRRGAPRD
ncbi:MAG: hypothetical protein JNL97_17550 [Verrucomicrobiales bacterium]|nr:hypothetical protein [Verrucomicrobiales bacterium]